MKRLTRQFMYGLGHKDCCDACSMCDVAGCCDSLEEMLEKLAHYEHLEEQLEKLYGGKMPLDEVVENLNRIVQNGEEKLDYARILTNAEAEKWARWLDLEEADRLIELPFAVGDTVWFLGSKCDACDEDDCYGCPYNRNGSRKNEKFLYMMTIKQFRITKNAVYMVDTDAVWSSSETSFNIDEIGKTVFLSKEEAEAKLKELRGAE